MSSAKWRLFRLGLNVLSFTTADFTATSDTENIRQLYLFNVMNAKT